MINQDSLITAPDQTPIRIPPLSVQHFSVAYYLVGLSVLTIISLSRAPETSKTLLYTGEADHQ